MKYTKPFITIEQNFSFSKREELYTILPLVNPYDLSYQRKCIWSSPKRGDFFKEIEDISNLKNYKRNFDVIGVYNESFGVNNYDEQNERMYITAPDYGDSEANLPPKKFAIFTFNSGEPYIFRGVFSLTSYYKTPNNQQWILPLINDKMTWEI